MATIDDNGKRWTMRLKRLSVLTGVGVPLIAASAAHAGFVALTTEVKTVPPGTPVVEGALVVNVFANFDRPGQDLMLSVAGTPSSPMDINVIGGTFYQNPFGSDKAPNAALIPVFPSLAFDSFVTIGVKAVGPGGQPNDSLVLTPGWPGFGPDFLGLPDPTGSNMGWAVTPNDPQSDPFNPNYVAGNGHVLVGQFTTLTGAAIVGMVHILVRSNGVSTQLDLTFSSNNQGTGASFFTDSAAFDAALVGASKASKAAWNFKPNQVDDPTGIALDDPLDIDTHALDPDDPWGKLWPPAIDNVTFRANKTPDGPLTPRGANALAFFTEGFVGTPQDMLIANFLPDSFTIESGVPRGLDHSAIGLQVVNAFAPATLVVRVYDPDDNLMGVTEVSVNAGEPKFLGILGLGDNPALGRVDVHNSVGGFEGVQSVALYRDNAVLFDDAGEFAAFNASQGKTLAGTETFEESNIPPNGASPIHDGLISHSPDIDGGSGLGFPTGLSQSGLRIQTNITPGASPPDPNPSGAAQGLLVLGPGFSGSNSNKVGEFLYINSASASLDIIITKYCPWDCGDGDGHVGIEDFLKLLAHWGTPGPCDFNGDGSIGTPDLLQLLANWGVPPQCVPPPSPVPTAMAFELSRTLSSPNAGWHITVYDTTDTEIGQFIVPAPGVVEPAKTFVGISCISTIGRVNIYDEASPALDAVDDIQLWE